MSFVNVLPQCSPSRLHCKHEATSNNSPTCVSAVRGRLLTVRVPGCVLVDHYCCCACRPGRAPGVSCAATVQLTAPTPVTTPRQVPAKSIALEPVVQEATIHYGKPMRGSPTPLGATCIKEAVSTCNGDRAHRMSHNISTQSSPGTEYLTSLLIVEHCR